MVRTLGLAVLIAACGSPVARPARPPIAATAAPIAKAPATVVLVGTGVLAAVASSEVTSPVSGKIVDVRADVGARVSRGETLAMLRQQPSKGPPIDTPAISPIDGIVIERRIEVGQTTAIGATSPVLFVVARIDKLALAAHLTDPRIAIGMSATISVGGKDITAVVERTGETVDFVLPNPDGSLRPGAQATARITVPAQ